MADPVWPASLPQPRTGYKLKLVDGAIRTPMDGGGAPKSRRRFTAIGEPIEFSLSLTGLECATLRTFWRTTTAVGTLRFDFPHPLDDVTVKARFQGPPNFPNIVGHATPGSRQYEVPVALFVEPA